MNSTITLIILCLFVTSLAETRTVPREDLPPLEERGLRFRIEMSKETYFVAEPIACDTWIENTTEKEQLYNESEISALDCVLYHEAGEPADYCGLRPTISRVMQTDSLGRVVETCEVLNPHGLSAQGHYDLLEYFGKTAGFHCGYLPVGSYYLTCPKIVSDTTWFEVIMPTDARSLSALALFDSASFAIVPDEFAGEGNKGKRNIIDSEIYRYDLICRLLKQYPDIYFRPLAEHHAKAAAVYSGLQATPMTLDSLPIIPLRELIAKFMETTYDLGKSSIFILYINESDFELFHDTPVLRATLESLLLVREEAVRNHALALFDYLDSLK